jgi:hypothetical protein
MGLIRLHMWIYVWWHVHEKASLHFTIPLALIALDNLNDARHYFLLSIGMFLLLMLQYLLSSTLCLHLLTHTMKQCFWIPFLSVKKLFSHIAYLSAVVPTLFLE